MTNDIETEAAPSPIAEGLKVINEGLATDKTPEQIAADALAAVKKAELEKQKADNLAKAKEAQAALSARIDELKSNVGKTFKPQGESETRIKVIEYAGVHKLNGQPAHMFAVDSKKPQAHYLVGATKFLETHEVVEVKETATVEII